MSQRGLRDEKQKAQFYCTHAKGENTTEHLISTKGDSKLSRGLRRRKMRQKGFKSNFFFWEGETEKKNHPAALINACRKQSSHFALMRFESWCLLLQLKRFSLNPLFPMAPSWFCLYRAPTPQTVHLFTFCRFIVEKREQRACEANWIQKMTVN